MRRASDSLHDSWGEANLPVDSDECETVDVAPTSFDWNVMEGAAIAPRRAANTSWLPEWDMN
jgi:hypothetical protein